jgi:hypothetical protein
MAHRIESVKIIDAKQAKTTHRFKNIKLKVLKCSASIWFNRHCRAMNLTPRYAQFNSITKNEWDKITKNMASRFRMGQELKFLYKKKQYLNTILYQYIWNVATFGKAFGPLFKTA